VWQPRWRSESQLHYESAELNARRSVGKWTGFSLGVSTVAIVMPHFPSWCDPAKAAERIQAHPCGRLEKQDTTNRRNAAHVGCSDWLAADFSQCWVTKKVNNIVDGCIG
jgi:hypothetical protein